MCHWLCRHAWDLGVHHQQQQFLFIMIVTKINGFILYGIAVQSSNGLSVACDIADQG